MLQPQPTRPAPAKKILTRTATGACSRGWLTSGDLLLQPPALETRPWTIVSFGRPSNTRRSLRWWASPRTSLRMPRAGFSASLWFGGSLGRACNLYNARPRYLCCGSGIRGHRRAPGSHHCQEHTPPPSSGRVPVRQECTHARQQVRDADSQQVRDADSQQVRDAQPTGS